VTGPASCRQAPSGFQGTTYLPRDREPVSVAATVWVRWFPRISRFIRSGRWFPAGRSASDQRARGVCPEHLTRLETPEGGGVRERKHRISETEHRSQRRHERRKTTPSSVGADARPPLARASRARGCQWDPGLHQRLICDPLVLARIPLTPPPGRAARRQRRPPFAPLLRVDPVSPDSSVLLRGTEHCSRECSFLDASGC
jgi:hypothetical protein